MRFRVAIGGENNLGFGIIDFLVRFRAEESENVSNSGTVVAVSLSKEGKVIYKEWVRDIWSPSTDGYRKPLEGIHFIIDSSR